MTEPVDLVLNLAPVAPDQLAPLLTLIRDGGTFVNATVWLPAPSDEKRPALHARAGAGDLPGRTVILAPTA